MRQRAFLQWLNPLACCPEASCCHAVIIGNIWGAVESTSYLVDANAGHYDPSINQVEATQLHPVYM
jgi:hypothetical protein